MNTHPAAPDQLVSSRRRDRRLWNAVLMTTRVILTISFSRCEQLPCETRLVFPCLSEAGDYSHYYRTVLVVDTTV